MQRLERSQRSYGNHSRAITTVERLQRSCVSCNLNDPSDYMELNHQRSRQLQRSNVSGIATILQMVTIVKEHMETRLNWIDSDKRDYFHKQTAT